MGEKMYKKILQTSLLNFWENVDLLSLQECNKLIGSFRDHCVKDDFKNKFNGEYGLSNYIGKRFLKNYEYIPWKKTIQEIFHIKVSFVTIEIVWGDENGFILKGKSSIIDDLFIDNGEAIAKISIPGTSNIGFLFYEHDGDVCKFPKTGWIY